jgi:hypothetical protein
MIRCDIKVGGFFCGGNVFRYGIGCLFGGVVEFEGLWGFELFMLLLGFY